VSRRFERFAGNTEAWIIGAVVTLLAMAYLVSLLRG
jgi:hypothetical protein